MAYARKELKAKVLDLIKTHCAEKQIKIGVTAKIEHHSTLHVNVQSCTIDLVQNMIDTCTIRINGLKENGCYGVAEMQDLEYMLDIAKSNASNFENYRKIDLRHSEVEKYFSGEALSLVKKIKECIAVDYYNNSDVQSDYFDVAYYWSFYIGNNKGGFKVKA